MGSGGALSFRVRVALLPGYEPTAGDTVLVADGDEPIVIAVLAASRAYGLVARDGSRAEVTARGFDVVDREGRLVVRYADGAAEIAPPVGDLVLRAPLGSVRIDAAADVSISAARDAIVEGARRSELRLSRGEAASAAHNPSDDLSSRVSVDRKATTIVGPSVEVRSRAARLVAAKADVVAQAIRTSASSIDTVAKKIDVSAERVTTHAHDVVMLVTNLVETRARRMRTLIRETLSIRSRSTALRSKEDTSIDGRRVLLG